jgi:hypothetical protein
MLPNALAIFSGLALGLSCGLCGVRTQAQNNQAVVAKARIVGQSYCRADADLFTVSLKLDIDVLNPSKESIYVKKSMIPWVAKVASNTTDAQSGRFMFEITQSHYPQMSKNAESVRIASGKSITLHTGYDLVARYNPTFSYAKSLASGNYAIILVLRPETEPLAPREGSNVIDTLTTEPFSLEVKQNPSVVNCASSSLTLDRNKSTLTGGRPLVTGREVGAGHFGL